MSEKVAERTKWGRVKYGAKKKSAMRIAIPIGTLIALGLALLAGWADVVGPRMLLGVTFVAIALAVPCTALVYVLLVDRSTMLGAPDDPDESIEARWYERAAAETFMDVMVSVGVVAGLASVLDWKMDGVWVLMGVWAVGGLSFALRYLLISRRG